MGKGRARHRYTLVVAIMAEQWRILVVEGEENLNWNIVNSLQKDGYFVLGVASTAEAMRALWSEEYDVVIGDQQMANADMFDLLQWMRTYCPDARMVMLGNAGGSVSRTQALEMGVASYLEKPLDLHALKEELRRLLHATGFSASLDSFDLLDVIQIINMSRKNISLVVNTGLEEQGTLRFQTGELVWAEYGALRGEEAFFALAAHKNGTVVHQPWNEQATPNVTKPLSRLIFQALQYRSKYAEQVQLSSEFEAIRPGNFVPDPPTLPPLPDTLQDMQEDDTPFQFLEESDLPFQFAEEKIEVENTGIHSAFEQLAIQNNQAGVYLEQGRGNVGMGKSQKTEEVHSSGEREKAWWEPTGKYRAFQMSGSMRAVTDEELRQALPTNGTENSTPSTVHKAVAGPSSPLPSWLTDQPTNMHLPVMRDNTGQIPAVPREHSPVSPQMPPMPAPFPSATPPVLPVSPLRESSEWLEQPRQPLHPTESGLRKSKEESMSTMPHRVIKPQPPDQSNGTRSVPAEWQVPPALPPLENQTGQMSPVQSPRRANPQEDTLHSLAALKKANVETHYEAGSPQPASTWRPPASDGPGNSAQKWNKPALAAALQTLGYSVPGFIAATVASLDGTSLAQVAVDERDIAPLCAHFSSVIQAARQASGENDSEGFEHTIIANSSQHILLRLIGKRKDVFQALITTRETNPVESLEIMANIDAAIAAALS